MDLNLGCPQRRAREGHYGAYLTDPSEWGVCCSIIRAAASHPELRIPVTAKIRLQQDVSDSVRFAEMLADAGARLIAVHGRRRGCENQRRDGSADLTAVAKIVDALHSREMPVPVVTNGNVRCEDDISANLRLTGAKGIMVAEHLLKDPAVFARAGYVCPSVQLPSVVALAEEYVAAAEKMAVGMDDNRFVPATGDKGGYRGAVGLQEVLPGDAAERLSVWWANAEVVKSHLRSQLGERGALVSRNTFKRASTVEEVFSCFRKRFRLPQAASDGHATATSTRDGILSRQPPQEETPSDSG